MTDEQCLLEFAKKLRCKMESCKINQRELAKISGVSESTISRYLAGDQPPKFFSVIKIAKALNANVKEFEPL